MNILKELSEEAMVLEPREVYDEAIICVDEDGRAMYSMELVIECGVKLHDTYEESLEWHDYNTFSTYMGEMTPRFLTLEEINDLDFGTKWNAYMDKIGAKRGSWEDMLDI
jgi:hypothetical protein